MQQSAAIDWHRIRTRSADTARYGRTCPRPKAKTPGRASARPTRVPAPRPTAEHRAPATSSAPQRSATAHPTTSRSHDPPPPRFSRYPQAGSCLLAPRAMCHGRKHASLLAPHPSGNCRVHPRRVADQNPALRPPDRSGHTPPVGGLARADRQGRNRSPPDGPLPDTQRNSPHGKGTAAATHVNPAGHVSPEEKLASPASAGTTSWPKARTWAASWGLSGQAATSRARRSCLRKPAKQVEAYIDVGAVVRAVVVGRPSRSA